MLMLLGGGWRSYKCHKTHESDWRRRFCFFSLNGIHEKSNKNAYREKNWNKLK